MIEIKDIHKSFGDNEVLKGISGTFKEGITNLIIGGSGSGKTTLLKCMIGLHQPEQGSVLYDDREFTQLNFEERIEIRKEIGMLFQGSADYSGNYTIKDMMPLNYMKYSAALIFGKRPSELKQWGVGVARTYRVGEINYIPVVLFNSTDVQNKWGTEMLFPARVHVRRTINSRNMLFAGYELEGQSYRMWNTSSVDAFQMRDDDLEIRRGEIRLRMVYEFSLKEFIWMSIQAGYRINYRFDMDRLINGEENYRAFGLIDDMPPYVMINNLTNPLYFNVSINLVSP